MDARTPLIGTAGWSIRPEHREAFPSEGSHLERYATRFNAVEINSSFYRPHRRATYERWADTVGDVFRFSVKLPKTISHAVPTADSEIAIERFAQDVQGLGDKLAVVLIQFPPSFAYDEASAGQLLRRLQKSLPCPLACEPRHASWFGKNVDAMLDGLGIARVAADPAVVPSAARPGGWPGLLYRRLHGSPKVYYSNYEPDVLEELGATLSAESKAGLETWCILDNTALGCATTNALHLRGDTDRDGRLDHPIKTPAPFTSRS